LSYINKYNRNKYQGLRLKKELVEEFLSLRDEYKMNNQEMFEAILNFFKKNNEEE